MINRIELADVLEKMIFECRDSIKPFMEARKKTILADFDEKIKCIAELEQERDELTRKGENLCGAYGAALIETHDLKARVEAAGAEVERLGEESKNYRDIALDAQLGESRALRRVEAAEAQAQEAHQDLESIVGPVRDDPNALWQNNASYRAICDYIKRMKKKDSV